MTTYYDIIIYNILALQSLNYTFLNDYYISYYLANIISIISYYL